MTEAQTYSEELVWAQSEDGIRLAGAVTRPAAGPVKPLAVVQVPGWDIAFSHPLHVLVGRVLAARGYISVAGNHRGSLFGEIVERDDGYAVIGAGWERFSECPLDIGPWVEYALGLGARSVALLGHSLGAAKVVAYQAERQHPQVAALICASPGPLKPLPIAAEMVAAAQDLLARGRGDELLPWGAAGEGMTLSAQTLLDRVPGGGAAFTIFDLATPGPLAQIRCPLLAFYGTGGDIGSKADLEGIRHGASAARRVDTRLVADANHVYRGREQEVGAAIAAWLDTLLEGAS